MDVTPTTAAPDTPHAQAQPPANVKRLTDAAVRSFKKKAQVALDAVPIGTPEWFARALVCEIPIYNRDLTDAVLVVNITGELALCEALATAHSYGRGRRIVRLSYAWRDFASGPRVRIRDAGAVAREMATPGQVFRALIRQVGGHR